MKFSSYIYLFILILAACSKTININKKLDNGWNKITINDIKIPELAWQNITGYDVYVDQGVIHCIISVLTDKSSKKTSVYYIKSFDDGQNWSKPLEINNQIDMPVISKLGNDIQIAVINNRIMVAWETSGEIPNSGPLIIINSLDAGSTWQKATNPTNDNTEQAHADIVAEANGSFHIVWLDDRDENGYQGLRYARSEDVGQHWTLTNTIDKSTCSCCWNRVIVGVNSELNVLYRDMEYRDMVLAESKDQGLSWQQKAVVGEFNWKFDGCPHNGGGLTDLGNGTRYSSVWTGKENKQGLYVTQSVDEGKEWANPKLIDANGFHSDIASNATSSNVAMIWDSQSESGSHIFISKTNARNQDWSKPYNISSSSETASFPRIVAGNKGWLALWVEQNKLGLKHLRSAVLQ